MKSMSVAHASGTLAICIAASITAGRLFGISSLAGILPGANVLGAFNLVLMFGVGLNLICLSRGWSAVPIWQRPILRFSLAILAAVPCGFLFEATTGIALGIDLAPSNVVKTLMSPFPGRMSPNAAIAYLAIGIALFMLTRPRWALSRRIAHVCAVIAGLIATSALVGNALGLQSLYRIGGYNKMVPTTAIVIAVCTLGLWTLIRPINATVSKGRHLMGQTINRRAALMFAVIAFIGGLSGFAVLRTSFEEMAANNLLATARVAATTLVGEIEAHRWYPKVVAERSTIHVALKDYASLPNRALALEELERIGKRYLDSHITGAIILDAQGQSIFQVGKLVEQNSSVIHPILNGTDNAALIWSQGYILQTKNEVLEGNLRLGTVIVQTRMPRFDAAVVQLRESSTSSDAAICSRIGDHAVCGPSRLRLLPFNLPLNADSSTAAYTIKLALRGESGTREVRDPTGANVISAYVPIGDYGIALGLKTEVSKLYSSLGPKIVQLFLITAALVLASTLWLREQLRPLIDELSKEQQRTASILENSNDAFFALDAAGEVTDWNKQAQKMFGWSANEAIGRRISELIIPPNLRSIYEQGMAEFRTTGTGAGVNKRVELQVMRRDGTMIPVELSVKAEPFGSEFIAHAFLHDISERKAAQQALTHSGQRIKLIANNLPALVSHIDRDFRYTFTNVQYQNWFGLDHNTLVGKTVAEVFGPSVFAGVRDQMTRALNGEDVTFELENPVPNSPANMLVHYLPDRDPTGNVVGIFGMVLDRTAQHEARHRVEASERQLRAVTDNLPVLITYVDENEILRYVNNIFSQWFGVPVADVINFPLAAVLGPQLYEQRRDQIRACLQGERVAFNVASETRMGKRHLETVYIPDIHPDGKTHGIFTVSMDVTHLKNIEQELNNLARVDTLTGLPNRRHFDESLEEALARSRRGEAPFALMFLDVDFFKSINDTFGHTGGDVVLTIFATRLRSAMRDTDLVARLAGDEFVIILEGISSMGDASAVVEKVITAIRQPFDVAGSNLNVTSSIGVAVSDGRQTSAAQILDLADQALYQAKNAGRNCYKVLAIGVS